MAAIIDVIYGRNFGGGATGSSWRSLGWGVVVYVFMADEGVFRW